MQHQLSTKYLTFLFILMACGKGGDEAATQSNPDGAPPAPVADSTSTPASTTTAPSTEELDDELNSFVFNRFNRVLGNCRSSLYRRGNLLGYLIQMLQNRENFPTYFPTDGSFDFENRGFHSGGQGTQCIDQVQNGMGGLRDQLYSGRFQPGSLQSWLGHSTDWAVNGTQYPNYWPGGKMPQGPMYGNPSGQSYFSPFATSTGDIPITGGGYFNPY